MEKLLISRDDNIWQGHPDIVSQDHHVFIVWRESDRHLTNGGTRIKLLWAELLEDNTLECRECITLAESIHRLNCPRISIVDGKLWIVCDEIQSGSDYISSENDPNKTHIVMWTFDSVGYKNVNGKLIYSMKFSSPIHTNIRGIVPDKLIKFKDKYCIATHTKKPNSNRDRMEEYVPLMSSHDFESGYMKSQTGGHLATEFWTVDDLSKNDSWEKVTISDIDGFHFCESSIMFYSGNLYCLMRENSGDGEPAYWSKSDNGIEWSFPHKTRLFGCHRPTWNKLASGNILVTYREQSSVMNKRCWARNTFAALIPINNERRTSISDEAIILPLDHDRSLKPDGGYTGWTQLSDGRIFVVNYITDDADKPFIRGYILKENDFIFDNQQQ